MFSIQVRHNVGIHELELKGPLSLIKPFSAILMTEGLGSEEQIKVNKAVAHWEKAFNSDKFKVFIAGHFYETVECTGRLWWKKCYRNFLPGFRFDGGLSKEQIYDVLFGGLEVLGDGKIDNTAQVYLRVDRSNRRGVVGYMYPGSKWQFIYSWVLKSYTVEQVAGNLAHEYAHCCGFFDSSYAASRGSVTYSVGEFVSSFRG